jgi:hypothetical protein
MSLKKEVSSKSLLYNSEMYAVLIFDFRIYFWNNMSKLLKFKIKAVNIFFLNLWVYFKLSQCIFLTDWFELDTLF